METDEQAFQLKQKLKQADISSSNNKQEFQRLRDLYESMCADNESMSKRLSSRTNDITKEIISLIDKNYK